VQDRKCRVWGGQCNKLDLHISTLPEKEAGGNEEAAPFYLGDREFQCEQDRVTTDLVSRGVVGAKRPLGRAS